MKRGGGGNLRECVCMRGKKDEERELQGEKQKIGGGSDYDVGIFHSFVPAGRTVDAESSRRFFKKLNECSADSNGESFCFFSIFFF